MGDSGHGRSGRGAAAGRGLVALVAAVAVCLPCFVGFVAWRSREDVLAEGRKNALNLARVLEQHAARTFEAVDLNLDRVAVRFLASDGRLDRILRMPAKPSVPIRHLFVTDADGRVVAQSDTDRPTPPPVSGQDYFLAQRDGPSGGLFIGPNRRDPVDGRWSVTASRTIEDVQGRFAGIVGATVDPDRFQAFYASLDVGPNGTVSLIATDGRMLFRQPWLEGATGVRLVGETLFRDHLRGGGGGVTRARSAVDGTARVYAYRRVPDLPLLAVVGLAEADLLAGWYDRTSLPAGAAAVALALLGATTLRLRRALTRVDASETLFRGVFETSPNGLLVVAEAPSGVRVEAANPMARRLAGEAGGTADPARPGPLTERVLAELAAPGASERAVVFEEMLPGPDGRRRVLDVTCTRLGGRDGRTRRVVVVMRDIARFREAEAELREANRRLVLSEEIAGIGHWRLDIATRQLAWSAGIYRMRGLDPATGPLSAQDWAHMNPFLPEDRAAMAAVVERAIADGQPYEASGRLRRSDGEVREIVSRGRAELDGQGRTVALVGVSMDVTEIRRAERALAEKSALLDAALDGMEEGLTIVGPDGRVALGNRRAAAFGLTPVGAMADHPGFAVPDGGEVVLADGRALEVRVGAMAGGAAVRTFTDITARRRAEADRRESEARYRLLADNTSDMITLRTRNGQHRAYVSPAVRRVLGYEPETFLRTPIADLVHPDDLGAVRAAYEGLEVGGAFDTLVHRTRHARGHWVWVEVAMQRVAQGPSFSIVSSIRDVTERKAAEGLLASAKEAAERASAAKSDFLASMSHEIRTPLNGVLGYADLLIEEPGLSPRQRAHARHIQAAGSALLTVLDDVLDFSAIEAGRVVLQPRPFAPADLAEEACAIVRGLAERKGLALEARVEPGLPGELVGDPDRLRQVLLNLLNNAVKFTARGRVILTLAPADLPETNLPETEPPETERSASGSGRPCGLRVSVSDTGIGIAPEKRDRLFQRFSQLDGSIRREFGGTGLGLAISQRLVGLMGGTIEVESAPGTGSTFGFVLALPEAGPALAAAGSSGVVGPGRAARVLLVEDLAINQELARAVLEGVGHAVDVVGDGSAAVAAVRSGGASGQRYDVVLMDVQMPGLDGLSATRAIRGLGGAAGRVPIVAMTANVLPEQLAACRAAGMDGHVGKPFRRQQLLDAVERWCGPTPADLGDRPDDVSPIDAEAFEAMRDLVGPARAAALLGRLAEEIDRRLSAEALLTAEPAALRRDAHALVSSAGALGFRDLARLCVGLEAACLAGDVPGALLAEVGAAGNEAIAEIERLRAA